jgi:hypothetical protein
MNQRFDYERGTRLAWLCELMEHSPNKPVRKLQWEALKYYPVASKELIRDWMKLKTAFQAADIMNRKQFPEYYPDTGSNL